MRILISGLNGHMGRELAKIILRGYKDAVLVAGVDLLSSEDSPVPCADSFSKARTDVDCIVDFSHHSCTRQLLDFALSSSIPVVLATTGQDEDEKKAIVQAAARIPIFFAANCSVGIALLIELAKKAAACLPDAEIEIIEAHHDRKLDAPSGTALAIFDALREVRPDAAAVPGRSGQGKRTKKEIGIHSIRMGDLVGQHTVLIGTGSQTITLKHEAHSRALFAEGALAAAEFIRNKPAGLYNMQDMLNFK